MAGSYRIPGGSVERFSSPGFDVDRDILLDPEGADILSWLLELQLTDSVVGKV